MELLNSESMLLPILGTLTGFVVLYYGAGWLVRGAMTIALHFNVSKVVIGLTLVAFGTSSPELVVNVVAAFRNHTDFALANVSGSNLTNLCLGFGLCALAGAVRIDPRHSRTDLIFLAVTPCLVLFAFLVYPGGGTLPFWAVYLFALLLALYLGSAKKRLRGDVIDTAESGAGRRELWFGIAQFLAGCTLLYLGGELILFGAVRIAARLGLSEAIIGLTVVAAGTSIPDVMASLVAIRRKENSIAVGNLLGSNIFNILLVLGGTLLASGERLVAERSVAYDYVAVSILSVLFFLIVLRSSRISKLSGLFFILVYLGYMTARIVLR